jgi:hypothetical protein
VEPGIDLAEWYASHALVRRLWAIRDAEGLRVLVTLEPTPDGDDTQPAWIANREAWVHELQAYAGSTVRLEQIDHEVELEAESVLVAAFSWRDPTIELAIRPSQRR